MHLAEAFGRSADVAAWARAQWFLRNADSIGTRCRVWGKPRIVNSGRLVAGDRLQLLSRVATTDIVVGDGGTLEIGDRVYINHGTSIGATELVRIGSDCSIGTHVVMMDNDFHRIEPERRRERPASQPIVLEPNVWLGASVIVLRGVTIGEGSAIGAGSVVTSNIPPRSLAVGSPARVIRSL